MAEVPAQPNSAALSAAAGSHAAAGLLLSTTVPPQKPPQKPILLKHRAHNTRQNGMGIPVMQLLNSTPAQNQENLNVGLNDCAAQMHNEMHVFTRFGNK